LLVFWRVSAVPITRWIHMKFRKIKLMTTSLELRKMTLGLALRALRIFSEA
jgi:hypothetical protein